MPTSKICASICAIIVLQLFAFSGFAQNQSGQSAPAGFARQYTVAGVSVTGTKYLDAELIALAAGIKKGDKIVLHNDPKVAKAIKDLWAQGLFSDIKFLITDVNDDAVVIQIAVVERPRLGGYIFQGINKTQESEIKSKLKLVEMRMVTEALKKDIQEAIRQYFSEKGYYRVQSTITEQPDTSASNSVNLVIRIRKGEKVRINQVTFSGNENASDVKLKSKMKGTKEMPRVSLYAADNYSVYGEPDRSFKSYLKNGDFLSLSRTLEALNPYFRWNIFASSKYNPRKMEEDESAVLAYYNSKGYRDAQIVADTTYFVNNGNLNVEIKIDEGQKYYFGDIDWRGNTKYSDSLLSKVLGIKKGDVYNQELLAAKLHGGDPTLGGMDITSLYMDDGYLFFQVYPLEKSISGDTIDYEIVIQEGTQATIKNITISGNDRTNDHVIRRELFTYPGDKFSRANVIRSSRQIANLGFIDPEKINPVPTPNYSDGTVDIDYGVAEKPSDQLELSAGFGGNTGFIGSVGIKFSNFSIRNLFNFKQWDPLPMGDGQNLSIRYQSNGLWYNSAALSFTEPWLGGKKPTALTINVVYGRQSYSSSPTSGYGNYFSGNPNDHYLRNWGGGVMLSKRLTWPDDYFIFSYGINYQNYYLKDYAYSEIDNFTNGTANNLFFRLVLARNSVDQPIYPRSGANINFTFQFTPPYSAFSETDYGALEDEKKFKWVEYHKYRFTAEWYHRIAGDLVLKLAAKYGFLGYYNKDIGFSPFERFSVGGDGLSGFNMIVGRDIISHRGYDVYAPNATIFNKYTAEIRYPFSLNPSATIFGLAFVEAGNGWSNFQTYNPFNLYRSAGLGVRIFLPMFGLLGLDYGIGFDKLGPGVKLGAAAKFTFMLGQEPD